MLLICFVCPLSALAASPVTDVYNYHPMHAGLGTSSQPAPRQFAAIKTVVFDTVFNLAMPTSDSALPDEGGLVAEQGIMTYVHIPAPWEAPTKAHPQQFFGVVDAMVAQGQEVWVHCAANYRASAFSYRYLTEQQSLSSAEARTPLQLPSLTQMDEKWRRIYDASPAKGSQP